MKIRLDYVSNSSSSSFMLVGDAFDNEAIANAWKKLHPEDTDIDDDTYEQVLLIAKKLDLYCHRGLDNYYDMWVLGLRFDDMKDDETKKQFEDRIKESLSTVFDNVNVDACVDGGYDG